MSESEPLEIYFNGESRQTDSRTVEALLLELELVGKRVAVELNCEVVSRDRYRDTALSVGDRVEIVHFVGGG